MLYLTFNLRARCIAQNFLESRRRLVYVDLSFRGWSSEESSERKVHFRRHCDRRMLPGEAKANHVTRKISVYPMKRLLKIVFKHFTKRIGRVNCLVDTESISCRIIFNESYFQKHTFSLWRLHAGLLYCNQRKLFWLETISNCRQLFSQLKLPEEALV